MSVINPKITIVPIGNGRRIKLRITDMKTAKACQPSIGKPSGTGKNQKKIPTLTQIAKVK